MQTQDIRVRMGEETQLRMIRNLREYERASAANDAEAMLNASDPIVQWVRNLMHNEGIYTVGGAR